MNDKKTLYKILRLAFYGLDYETIKQATVIPNMDGWDKFGLVMSITQACCYKAQHAINPKKWTFAECYKQLTI